jgi:hypothetical protein
MQMCKTCMHSYFERAVQEEMVYAASTEDLWKPLRQMKRWFVNRFYSGGIRKARMYQARVCKIMCNYKIDVGSLLHSVNINR